MKVNKTNVNENSNKFRRVKRALFGDPTGKIKTFAILSPENPLGWKDSTEEEFIEKYKKWLANKSEYNRSMLDNIKAEMFLGKIKQTGDDTLKYGGFDYVQIKGSYGDKEHTLLIFNIPLADAKLIASNYGQESFFYGKTAQVEQGEQVTSKIAYYMTKDACKTYSLVDISNTITFEEEATDFFSKFGFKYRINMKEFGDDVDTVENNGEFEESMDEDRTFMSRASHRRMSRKSVD